MQVKQSVLPFLGLVTLGGGNSQGWMVKSEGQVERLGREGAGRREMHLEVSRFRYRGCVHCRERLKFILCEAGLCGQGQG